MNPTARLAVELPTHCSYSRCDRPLVQTPGKRARYFCCDAHRAAAHQEQLRQGRVVAFPGVRGGRTSAARDNVVDVHHEFRQSLEALRAMAEQLIEAMAPAADVRAAQALVDQAETALQARERKLLSDLNAEIEARIAAVDRAEVAAEAAELARQRVDAAEAAQAQAEAKLAEAFVRFEVEREALQREIHDHKRRADEAVAAAEARAATAEKLQQETAERTEREVRRVRTDADATVHKARESAARAEGARDAAIAEVQLARDDARRAWGEVEHTRAQLEQQLARERERTEAQIRELRDTASRQLATMERELESTKAIEQQTRADLQRVRTEAESQRQAHARELAAERHRALVRVEEVRTELKAQLSMAQQIADERGRERDRIAAQLEVLASKPVRDPTEAAARSPREKNREASSKRSTSKPK